MRAIEEAARQSSFSILNLDAKRGTPAEHLYRQLGWIHAGTIPMFAFDPDGTTPHDGVISYRNLSRTEQSPLS